MCLQADLQAAVTVQVADRGYKELSRPRIIYFRDIRRLADKVPATNRIQPEEPRQREFIE